MFEAMRDHRVIVTGLTIGVSCWYAATAAPALAQGGLTPPDDITVNVLPGVLYVNGHPQYDQITWVDGAPDGSAMFLVQHPQQGYSQWVFVNGRSMWLQAPSEQRETVTAVPGNAVTSYQYYDWDDEDYEYDKKVLTEYLVATYLEADILHVPFLTGEGWPAASGGGHGATLEQAEEYLDDLCLNKQIVGTKTTGHVISQNPAGGVIVSAQSTVQIELDGEESLKAAALTPPGNDPQHAIKLTDSGSTLKVKVWLSDQHTNAETLTKCKGDGRDVFWLLPSSWADATVTVTRIGNEARIAVTAYQDKDAASDKIDLDPLSCAYGRDPVVKFTVPPEKTDCYLSIDVPGEKPHWVELELERQTTTTAPAETSSGAQ
jgi:hypothetical protein